MTTNEQRLISLEDQFRCKAASHRIAAAAPIEEKIAKLLQLQKISCEMARLSGRSVKKPWNISIEKPD